MTRCLLFMTSSLLMLFLLLGQPAAADFVGEGGEDKKAKDKKDKGKKDATDKKDGPLTHVTVMVRGQQREAWVAFPGKSKTPAPTLFVFHGHGESAKVAAEAFGCHRYWDDAIVVYMQGVKTVRPSDPKGLQTGWETSGDRDIVFFDAMLQTLKNTHAVDAQRVFATGFSNGAMFVYELWETRGQLLRGVAPVAGTHKGKLAPPRPCLHIAGTKDTIVKFQNQEATIELVREANSATGKGSEWPKHKSPLHGTLYPSTKGAPTAKLIHGGGHEVPSGAGALIVEFFKDIPKK